MYFAPLNYLIKSKKYNTSQFGQSGEIYAE